MNITDLQEKIIDAFNIPRQNGIREININVKIDSIRLDVTYYTANAETYYITNAKLDNFDYITKSFELKEIK